MKTFKNILFDWDGCISCTLTIWMNAFKKGLKEHNIELDDITIARQLFPESHGVVNFGIADSNTFVKNLVLEASLHLNSAPLYSNVKETLNQLKLRGKKLAIVSSSSKYSIIPEIKRNEIDQCFDCVISREDVTNRKPHTEPLEKALELMKGKKEETLIIGDSHVDVEAGKQLGITTVLYYPKDHELFYPYEHMKGLNADFLIRDFKELLEIVR